MLIVGVAHTHQETLKSFLELQNFKIKYLMDFEVNYTRSVEKFLSVVRGNAPIKGNNI